TSSFVHPIDDGVMGVIEHDDVVGPFNRKEFHEWKFARELAPHSHWNHFVIDAVKKRDERGGIALHRGGESRTVVITLEQQSRDPAAENARRFLAQSRKRRDQNDFVDTMIGGEIERNGRA